MLVRRIGPSPLSCELGAEFSGRGSQSEARVPDDDIDHWNNVRARLLKLLEALKAHDREERERIETQIAAVDNHIEALKSRRLW